ncbi:MAG TPA: ABC transporter substrate-binding protein [Bacteroidetes bacterium]|nr:ABC transporter substrate-binding protein [Bacteroidota bacterium]
MMKYWITIVCLWTGLLVHTMAGAQEPLRAAYYPTSPFVIETDEGLTGASVWLWDAICKDLSLQYTVEELPLDTLLRAIEAGNKDMFIVPLSITSERNKFIQFTVPFYVASSGILIHSAGNWQKFTAFLRSFFSLAFLQALAALFFVLLFFGFLLWLFERRRNPEHFEGGWRGVWSGVWWSAVTMTTVGYGDKVPKSSGGRIIGLIWMFIAITIISGFTASIASTLTVQNMGWNRKNIQDYKELPIASVNGSATEEWLRAHFFKDIRALPNLDACLQALDAGEVMAVAYDEPALKEIVRLDSASRYQLQESSYNLQLYAFGFSKMVSDTLVERISASLLEITESRDYQVVLSEYDLIQE